MNKCYYQYLEELGDFEWLFLDYCSNGNLEGIKRILPYTQIFGLIHNGEVIHKIIQEGFYRACFGHLDIIKFLLTIENKLDIYFWDNTYFKIACNHGNLEIVQFLYPYYNNIIGVYEQGFVYACTACFNYTTVHFFCRPLFSEALVVFVL